MNRIPHIRYLAAALAGLAGALLAFAVAAPAALASGQPPPHIGQQVRFPPVHSPGWNKHPPLPAHAHTVIVHTIPGGGMPGWQIALIALGAALLAATAAVLAFRAWTIRRKPATGAVGATRADTPQARPQWDLMERSN